MFECLNKGNVKIVLCVFIMGVSLLCCPILAHADGADSLSAGAGGAIESSLFAVEPASSDPELDESTENVEGTDDAYFPDDSSEDKAAVSKNLVLSVSYDGVNLGKPVTFRLVASEDSVDLTYALTRICRVVNGAVNVDDPLLCSADPAYSRDSVIEFSFDAPGTYQLSFAARGTDAEAEVQCVVVIPADVQALEESDADDQMPSKAPAVGSEATEQPGSWVHRGGVAYYVYENGAFAKYQTKIGDKTYYFRSNGAMVIGKFVNGRYYGSDGVMCAERFFEHDGVTYYATVNGDCAHFQKAIDGKTYYFRSSGTMVRNKIVAGRYYGPDGAMRTNEFFKLGGTTYYARPDGVLAIYQTKIGGKTYYFRSNGAMVIGKFVENGFYGPDGILYVNRFFDYGGSRYYATATGTHARYQNVIGGKTYYFRSNGAMVRGKFVGSCFYGSDGAMYANRFFDYGGTTYYATGNGTYARYQNVINNKVYYFWSNGSMVRNRIVEKRIYASDGHMLKQSFYDIKGDRYYATADGTYAIAAYVVGGDEYYFRATGAMVRNRIVDRKIYGSEGFLLKNAFWYHAGSTYYATANGQYAIYAQTINKKKYYFWSNGVMVRNRMLLDHYYQNDGTMAIFCWVDNERYWVDEDGLWIPDMPAKVGWQNPAGYYQVSSKSMHMPAGYYATPSRINPYSTRDECISAFIARAWEYIGTPYVWNYSNAPGVGVDCIGLVYQCAYACGMDLGEFNPYDHWITGPNGWHSHDANNMWNYGSIRRLSLGERQRGDLIFWHGHVAIYIGNDRIIEAYPGVVRVTSLWAHGTPIGVGRLFI